MAPSGTASTGAGSGAGARPSTSSSSSSMGLGKLDMHTVWAVGHFILLGCSVRLLLATPKIIFGSGISLFWYRTAYVGALISYAVVIYKSIGIPRPSTINAAWLQRALMDDNVQYGLLAVWWFVSKPVYPSIVPFATFSLFHCLTFARTNILPKFYTKPTGANRQSSPSTPASFYEQAARRIQLWVKGNYDTAMRFVATFELALLGWAVFRLATFRGSFLNPLFLAHFIRLRYMASPFTRTALERAGGAGDRFFHANAPPVATKVWETAKRLVINWGGVNVQPQPGQAQAAGPGAAGAAAGRR